MGVEEKSLINTAGEPEREVRSRRANLLEALGVMLLLLVALWWVAYPVGVLLRVQAGSLGGGALVAALLLFAGALSPRWHRDTLASWGLGNPLELARCLHRSRPPVQLALAGLLGTGVGLLTSELYYYATRAKQVSFGIEPSSSFHLQSMLGSNAAVWALCLVIALVWTTCFIRYDNLWLALRVAAALLAILLPVLLLVAWGVNGPEVFRHGHARALIGNGLGYIFWGAMQQLLFCSYFGTRLRKAFGPGQTPAGRARKRLGVALLNGLFFGVVHMNSWLLVGFTWALGTIFAWFFMEDRYRNVQAFGLVHGVLGTFVLWLFSSGPATIRVRLRVGPWAMPHHLDVTMLVVGSGLIGALALALGAALKSGEREA
ncbi:MAG TPA: CPBP family glutamic-type intramembrane protease [Verrucomicrobiae bacterium]|nr:CPBP family glutamic-type intramembrane protease [Verrucomicrobiae bacterium]